MSAPPLPMGGPPPPLPNLPLPPPGGAPQMPPPMMNAPMRGGMGRSPFTNTLLLTNMPPFFVGYQQVRDWLYPCGTAKTCLFYPRSKKHKNDDESEETKEDENAKKPKTIVVNMLNPDQALKVVASFQQFSSQLDERYKDIRCYMVPASPDIPLPPPLMDETSKKVLGDKLWNNFVGLETSFSERDIKKESGSSSNNNKDTTEETSKTNEPKLLDADKAAAAAGGAYDADEDPLNAPQVLAAVKEFRRKLDKTHGSQKTQRMELVAKKLKELRPRIRARVEAEKAGRQAPPPSGLPPAGLPPAGLPPAGLPPPPTADSGKRGRSNLPAWMTQQQAAAGDEPSAKKQKTDATYPENFPSNLPEPKHAILRQFLANQVRESMGEEEATLIDFLYKHILQGKTTAELLQELKVVLEEEADAFLKAVWSKVQELERQ